MEVPVTLIAAAAIWHRLRRPGLLVDRAHAAPAATAVPPPTPTPSMSRTNPNIVEETATYIVERFPKDEYIRVDDNHFRNPLIPKPMEFFKEDDKYYYVYTYKVVPEEEAEKRRIAAGLRQAPLDPAKARRREGLPTPPALRLRGHLAGARPGAVPPRGGRGDRPARRGPLASLLRPADMNGDGIPDIVAPPSRLRRCEAPHLARRREGTLFALAAHVHRGRKAQPGFLPRLRRRRRRRHRRRRPARRRRRLAQPRPRVALRRRERDVRRLPQGLPARTSRRRPSPCSTSTGTASSTDRSSDKYESRGIAWNRDQVHVYLYAATAGGSTRRTASWSFVLELASGPGISTATGKRTFCREATTSPRCCCSSGTRATASFRRSSFRRSRSRPTTSASLPGLSVRTGPPLSQTCSTRVRTRSKRASPASTSTSSRTASGRSTASGGRRTRSPSRGRSPSETSTAMVWTTSSSRTRSRAGCGSFSRGRTAPSGRWTKRTSRRSLPVAQCVRLADLNGDGRLDIILSKTVETQDPIQGGWLSS